MALGGRTSERAVDGPERRKLHQNDQRYQVRFSRDPVDIAAAQALRHRAFFGAETMLDQDRFDEICLHVLVEDRQSGAVVCCFRLLALAFGRDIEQSYSAQFYDLTALHDFEGGLLEMGRFCIDPAYNDTEIVRAAWVELTRYVDENHIKMIFGCSSFSGTDPAAYGHAFATLMRRHLAPARWRVGIKAADVVRFATDATAKPDPHKAKAEMPPLLRSYLQMGGWVSDHAVIDRAMNTLHVFTGLEISAIPAARKRILRAMLSSSG